MKSTWPVVFGVAVLAFLQITQANSDEPEKTPSKPDAADKFIGKQAGQLRDDNGLKMKFIWCPPGEFSMGSRPNEKNRNVDEQQVKTILTNGFWLGKYEVTQAEWKQLMKTEPWKGQLGTKEGADFPVTWVNWNDATAFCRKLTEQERQSGRLPNDWEYALPTEGQWERACRAETETRFSFGDDESKLGDYAWFYKNSEKQGERYAHKVGEKKANPWGLCDMHGNVAEWCRDVYTEKLPGGRDPMVKPEKVTKDLRRVFRGGYWSFDAEFSRSAGRMRFAPDDRFSGLGFRVSLSSVQADR